MKQRKYRSHECYYCVCTACTAYNCPWRHYLLKHCQICSDRGKYIPLLDCDYFTHYLKTFHFKFHRAKLPLNDIYVLKSSYGEFYGNFQDLVKIQKRLGGVISKMDHIKYILGEFK